MYVLVTGATGYIGGRLIPRLLDAGHQVRVLVRDRDRLDARPWVDQVDAVEGNVLERDDLARALDGVQAAYYLVHSMCSGSVDFEERDRIAAETFADMAGHLEQVIYLGGILPDADTVENSKHLSSRAEVGRILRERLPTTEFRAGPIIGSGSASFEMVRYLTERLPVMTAPRWIRNEVQPIGVRNILEYLVQVLGRTDALGVIDVGADVLTFKEMLLEYARIRELPRVIIALPVPLGLAARWVALVTPILNCLAEPLVHGMAKPVVGDRTRALELFPDIEIMSYVDAVKLALYRVQERNVKTRWSDSVGEDESFEFEDREGVVREVRSRFVDVSPEAAFRAFTSLGGDRGWLVWKWAWSLRGFMDQLIGGPGLRRGRRDPERLRLGDAVDFWRVEEIEEPRLLRLQAEMKVPGRAWLQFEAEPEGEGTRLVQAALFQPKGFLGWVYWYSVYPAHAFIFDQMIDAIAELARKMARDELAGQRG